MRPSKDLVTTRSPGDVWVTASEAAWPEESTNLDFMKLIMQRRRVIVAALAFSALVLTAYAMLVPETPIYEGHVQLLLQPESRAPLSDSSGQPVVDPSNRYYETQQRILRSRTLVRRTLASLDVPSAGSKTGATTPAPDPATEPRSAVDAVPAQKVDQLLRALTVSRVPDTDLVDVRYRSTDPVYAARVANAHAQAYVRQSVEFTLLASRQASKGLTQPLEDQRTRLKAREAELRRYQQQYGAVADRQGLVTQRLSELNAAVLRARSQRVSKETTHQMLISARRSGKPLHELATLVASPLLQLLSSELATLQRRDTELAVQYGPRHPERAKTKQAIAFTENRLDLEVARAFDAAARDLQAAREEERRAIGALEAQTVEAAALGRQALDYDARKRDIANDRSLYERLEQRAQELRLSSDYDLSNIRVIDAAEVPSVPLPGTKVRNVTIAALTCLPLSVLLAFGVHYFDERVRSPEDIKTHLGLPYLGMVPKLPRGAPVPAVNARATLPAPFHEAVRDLRTHVLCTPAGQEARFLLVASAAIDEGKTLIATTLATGLAQVGYRVLLIDLDLRHPSVHKAFDVPVQPGLGELLSGAASAADAIRPSNVRGVWLLTAGREGNRNPGDLLGSSLFRLLMKNLPASFDRIVLDSPPVMAFTDASLVAHQQAGIVFVVSADRTGRRAAQAALERLEAVGARFVGAVLNRVDPRQNGSAFYPKYDYARQDERDHV